MIYKTAICKLSGPAKCDYCINGLLNAINICGGNQCIDEVKQCLNRTPAEIKEIDTATPSDKPDIKTKILQWLATGEKGISSEAIAFKMAGVVPGRSWSTHPYDPSDFKQCLKLVNFIPEIRSRLDEMRSISREWNAIIEHWKEIEECFMGEVAEWLTAEHSDKRAHKTYELMRKVYAGAVTQNP